MVVDTETPDGDPLEMFETICFFIKISNLERGLSTHNQFNCYECIMRHEGLEVGRRPVDFDGITNGGR